MVQLQRASPNSASRRHSDGLLAAGHRQTARLYSGLPQSGSKDRGSIAVIRFSHAFRYDLPKKSSRLRAVFCRHLRLAGLVPAEEPTHLTTGEASFFVDSRRALRSAVRDLLGLGFDPEIESKEG